MLKGLNINSQNYLFKSIYKKISTKNIISTDVCIVGGGSIGMTLSLLLEKFGVNHIILEREKNIKNLFNHPKAHYISPKTVETFKYINTFDEKYFKSREYIDRIDNWRHYRYCGYLLEQDSYYGEIDHLRPNKEVTIEWVNQLSNAYPLHIGQNKLNQILYDKINKQNFMSGTNVTNFTKIETEDNYLINTNNENIQIKSKFLVGCDGAHSSIRKNLNIKLSGTKGMQHFVNAHFFSKDLAYHLKKIKKDSMLHFIFNPKYVCVLISYDLDVGEFVMQIPFFPEVEKEADYTKNECERIIMEMISHNNLIKDSINIVRLFFNNKKLEDVKFWKMNNVVTEKWYQDRVFIIGDAAHQFPPSGGYGLNMGVSDAFSLAWRLKYLTYFEKKEENIIKDSYEEERIVHSDFLSKCAELNYNKFNKTCRSLGLNVKHCNLMQNVVKNVIPPVFQRPLFGSLMNTGIFVSNLLFKRNLELHLKELKNQIQLIFPYLDYGLNYKKRLSNDIKKYEDVIKIEDFRIVEGIIIPNYVVNNEIRLREYLKLLQEQEKDALFFVIRNIKYSENIQNIKIINDSIELSKFKFIEITNDANSNFYIEEFKDLEIVIIKPDFIVDKIK